jgi:hypothetical protein
MQQKIRQIIDIAWESFKFKVATGVFNPENEKMMQLQFALTMQSLAPVFEYSIDEKIKVLLEVPVIINHVNPKRVIDIVIRISQKDKIKNFPIELKCYRKFTRDGSGKSRGAQNIGMYDYWTDIENLEKYSILENYDFGTHLCLTDDNYYVTTEHKGGQVSVYSTWKNRRNITGFLMHPIANRLGSIQLKGKYSMSHWESMEIFHFIRQEYHKKPINP